MRSPTTVRDGRDSADCRPRGCALGWQGAERHAPRGEERSDRGELCMPVKVGASAARLALCPAGRKETAQAPGGKKGDVMSSVFRAKRAGGRMWGGRQPGATASGGQLRRPPRDSRGEGMGAAGTVSGGQPEGNELRRRV